MEMSIIIVSWNVQERLRINLESLQVAIKDNQIEIIVIDNASTDGTVAMLEQEFPRVQLIKNQKNMGFARACNQGLKQAQGRLCLLLNPDMKVLPTSLAQLQHWCDSHPEADVVGPKLVDSAGVVIPHVRRFPTWRDQLAIILKLPHLFPGVLNRYLYREFDYTQAAQVDSIRGACLVIRQESLKRFGLLDERYFLWFEEVDYCRTVVKKGGHVWYTPAAQVIDYVGQSFNQLPRAKKQQYFQTSMLAYFKKWEPWWQVIILKFGWTLGNIIVWFGDKINLRSRVKT